MSVPSACVPSSLRTILPALLSRGSCLVFPGLKMPVPIPLNECVVRDEHRLLWATAQSPFGPTRPFVGLLACEAWRPLGDPLSEGCLLLSSAGEEVARILPFDKLGLPTERARRLREDQARHEERASREPAYARRWAQRFREASAATDTPQGLGPS